VDKVLRELDSDVRCRDNYLLVQLNGLLHTDDRLALLDLAMQLDVDHDVLEGAKVCEAISNFKSYLVYISGVTRHKNCYKFRVVFSSKSSCEEPLTGKELP